MGIQYISPQVPDVRLPDYAGRTLQAMVPDTIDLQEMARLAVNGLTEPTDPDADYEIYWQAALSTHPPVMWHAESDIVQAKFMEALPLMRLISGSEANLHVEQRWIQIIRQMQGPDGLIYLPKIGRPWCKFGNYGLEPPGDHYFSPWFEGRILNAMTIYHALTGDDEWKRAGRRLVDGLDDLAQHDGSKAHFIWHEFGASGKFTPGDPALAVHNPATYHNGCIQGLANYARHTACEPAIELAGKLARWVMDDSNHFGPNGEFHREYPTSEFAHFHGHTIVLLAVLDYGLTAGDSDAIDFAHRSFRHGMTRGDCTLGFFPEFLERNGPETLELCELADMIALAIKLSAAGVGDYWDMADAWTRNLFHEGQLRWAEPVYWLSERTPAAATAQYEPPPYHSIERVVERNIGAFGGWLLPNDFMPNYPHDCQYPSPGIMHCCTGNSARAIYYIWENVISEENGNLRVNLLMNRSSRWADVDSHIPYAGRADINVREPVSLSVRIPGWTRPQDVACAVNGRQRIVRFDGRYAAVGNVDAGDRATVEFPITQNTRWVDIEKRRYRVLLRGSTCVAIDPPGRNIPLFQRGHLREEVTRWRSAKRFVSTRLVAW